MPDFGEGGGLIIWWWLMDGGAVVLPLHMNRKFSWFALYGLVSAFEVECTEMVLTLKPKFNRKLTKLGFQVKGEIASTHSNTVQCICI